MAYSAKRYNGVVTDPSAILQQVMGIRWPALPADSAGQSLDMFNVGSLATVHSSPSCGQATCTPSFSPICLLRTSYISDGSTVFISVVDRFPVIASCIGRHRNSFTLVFVQGMSTPGLSVFFISHPASFNATANCSQNRCRHLFCLPVRCLRSVILFPVNRHHLGAGVAMNGGAFIPRLQEAKRKTTICSPVRAGTASRWHNRPHLCRPFRAATTRRWGRYI